LPFTVQESDEESEEHEITGGVGRGKKKDLWPLSKDGARNIILPSLDGEDYYSLQDKKSILRSFLTHSYRIFSFFILFNFTHLYFPRWFQEEPKSSCSLGEGSNLPLSMDPWLEWWYSTERALKNDNNKGVGDSKDKGKETAVTTLCTDDGEPWGGTESEESDHETGGAIASSTEDGEPWEEAAEDHQGKGEVKVDIKQGLGNSNKYATPKRNMKLTVDVPKR
jgi:hypothetical protein